MNREQLIVQLPKCPKCGQIYFSPEFQAKHERSCRGRPETQTVDGRRGPRSPEVREKRRAAWNRPEARHKIRAAGTRQWPDPEVREKRRAALHRPEVREKRRAALNRPEV